MKEKKFIHLVFYLLFNLYIEYVDLHLSLVQRNDPYYHSEISYLINIPKINGKFCLDKAKALGIPKVEMIMTAYLIGSFIS